VTRRGRFALRSGIWRWALAVASERPSRPAAIAVRGGPQLESRRLTVGGRSLHVRAGGAGGTPVALVHGVLVSGRYMLPLAAELARRHRVLVPDLPGYGHSDPLPGRPAGAAPADALVDGCRAAGHDRIALVGNSFGAQIVVEAAVRRPEQVVRVALLGPTVDPGASSFPRQYLRWQRCARDEHLSVLPLMARDVCEIGPRRALWLLRAMLDDAIEDKLARVGCPALVVRGDRDRVVPARWAERVAGLLPHGRLAVVGGYAHMPHYSGPLALAPVLDPFLSAPDDLGRGIGDRAG
jgi:2-hydroxy-6-oxonona-2,4-dienedioate hydrolase